MRRSSSGRTTSRMYSCSALTTRLLLVPQLDLELRKVVDLAHGVDAVIARVRRNVPVVGLIPQDHPRPWKQLLGHPRILRQVLGDGDDTPTRLALQLRVLRALDIVVAEVERVEENGITDDVVTSQ